MRAPRIDVFIEELVLHGFAPTDRVAIAEAVQQELARRFVEQGVPAALTQGAGFDHLDGGAFPLAPAARAESIGSGVAQAVYGSLS
jgi:hypothetical protein